MTDTSTLQLPDGGVAILRDPSHVTERQRRPLSRLQVRLATTGVGHLLAQHGGEDNEAFAKSAVTSMTADDFALLDDINDALIVALVERITLGNGTIIDPVTNDSLLDLTGVAYDALKVETAKHVTSLMPTFTPTSDPKSPTPPSVD